MTDFWQDNVLADESSAPPAPAPIVNIQAWTSPNSGSAYSPSDADIYFETPGVTLDASNPTYALSFPVTNILRTPTPGQYTTIRIAIAPQPDYPYVYFSCAGQVKDSTSAVVQTFNSQGYQSPNTRFTVDPTAPNSGGIINEDNWGAWTILPDGEVGTLELTVTFYPSYNGVGAASCVLAGVLIQV